MVFTTRSKREKRNILKVKHGVSTGRTATAWLKKCGPIVVFVGTCLGVVAAIRQLVPNPCDTTIDPDMLMTVVKVDEREFEFQLPLTLMNTGGKPDRLDRPCVAFTSDNLIVQLPGQQLVGGCLTDVFFADKQEAVTFPIYLLKDEARHLRCIIKWTPSEDYEKSNSESLYSSQLTAASSSARIEITWKEKRPPVRFQFALLPAEDLRDMKRDRPKSINCLHDSDSHVGAGDGDHGDSFSSSFLALQSGPDGNAYETIGTSSDALANLSSAEYRASVDQQRRTHYAAQGEVASGKEVPSQTPDDVTVNIRPCGGPEDLVVFRARFKKRILGLLPCGVRMVQVEKL